MTFSFLLKEDNFKLLQEDNVSGIILQPIQWSFTVDAVLVVPVTTFTFTVDAVLVVPATTFTFTVDAFLQQLGKTTTFTVDAILGSFGKLDLGNSRIRRSLIFLSSVGIRTLTIAEKSRIRRIFEGTSRKK